MFLVRPSFNSCNGLLDISEGLKSRQALVEVRYNFLCPDMGQFDATKGKQALEIRSSLSEKRALTDPILPSECADLDHAHSRQWAKAHGESKTQTPHLIF